jgi:hypothetical protein
MEAHRGGSLVGQRGKDCCRFGPRRVDHERLLPRMVQPRQGLGHRRDGVVRHADPHEADRRGERLPVRTCYCSPNVIAECLGIVRTPAQHSLDVVPAEVNSTGKGRAYRSRSDNGHRRRGFGIGHDHRNGPERADDKEWWIFNNRCYPAEGKQPRAQHSVPLPFDATPLIPIASFPEHVSRSLVCKSIDDFIAWGVAPARASGLCFMPHTFSPDLHLSLWKFPRYRASNASAAS